MKTRNAGRNDRALRRRTWNPVWRAVETQESKTVGSELEQAQKAATGTRVEAAPIEPSILIVDDDRPSRLALAELLSAPGRNTVVAKSGEEALRLLLKHDFAVVILDVQMPGIDGFQTAKMMRERERSRHTPIIFLTASYQDPESIFRGYEAGAVDYIVKPPDADVLRSKVTVFVDLYIKNALLRREVAERKVIEEQLRASQESLRALAAHLQSVREEERTRISAEIHDQLGQELTGLKIELKWIAARLPKSPRTLAEKAQSTLQLIDQTIQSVRRIAAGLRPAVNDEAGFAAAMEWAARDFRRRTGIRCKVTLPSELPTLDQEQATALFRVCQELLTNVARHAEATRAEITVRADAAAVSLSVEDNGKGIGKVTLDGPKSLGFLGMRERLRPLGGRLEVDTGRSTGTKVKATLPLGAG
jgi:signal transduction histidine kinase